MQPFKLMSAGAVAVCLTIVSASAGAQEWPVFKSKEVDSEPESAGPRSRPRSIPSQAPKRKPQAVQVSATIAKKVAESPVHKLAIQVNENNPQLMSLALNNARNVFEYYSAKGQKVAIEVVTFGPGLNMLREDSSPVKQRIATMALETPGIIFIACANTQANMSRQENKPITLVSEAKLMPSGVVRLMELQASGYAYLRP